jgi:hypothetical protein
LPVSVTTSGVSAGRAEFVAHGGELFGAAPAHGPAQAAARGVALQQVFDDEAAGEAGGAVDDEVKGFGHGMSLSRLFARQGRERRL